MILPDIRDWYENKNDKFGYYLVGDYKTYSKLDAIELSRSLHKPDPKWIFNDTIFSAYDWLQEPVESLKELYTARAQQVRRAYDYIVLFFSGGADSTNMLQAFIQNNIRVDEIVVFVQEEGDKNPNSFFNVESTQVALPFLRKMSHLLEGTKISKIDLTNIVINMAQNNTVDLLYSRNAIFSPLAEAITRIRDYYSTWNELSEQGKKVVFLWGHQKPSVRKLSKSEYEFYIEDRLDFCVSSRTQMLNREHEYNELFYSSPDCVPLLIKQSHVFKRWLAINNNVTLTVNTLFLLNRLIYPPEWWDASTWSKGKPKSHIFTPSDIPLVSSNTDIGNFYLKQRNAIISKFGEDWYDSASENLIEKIKPIRSRGYSLNA